MAVSVILRFSKHKGNPATKIEGHHERKKEEYKSNPDINTARSKYNVHLITPQMSYKKEVDTRIKESGCRVRKDSTRFVDTLITASPEFFKGKDRNFMLDFFKRALDFMKENIRPDSIFSAVIHLDEKTPHMHLCFVPLTEDNRLTAKEILGNRARLSKWQDDFHGYMYKAYPYIERGVSSQLTHRKHIPTHIFKFAKTLGKMQGEIEKVLADTNIFNSSKNSQKAIELLEKWVPMVETFETNIAMLQRSFRNEYEEKEYLKEELNKRKKIIFDDTEKIIELKSQLERMQKLYDKVPEEIRAEIETRKKTKTKTKELER